MSTLPNGSGGTEQTPGGASDNPNDNPNPTTAGDQKPQTVSHETYTKVLDEAKKAKAKVAEYEREQKKRDEEALTKQGEYKKLAEQREQELKEEREKRVSLETRIADSRKLNAILGSVTGEVPKQYWGLIDTNQIAVDPETGIPDEASVKKAAQAFEKQFPDVVKKPSRGKLPDDVPLGGTGKLSYKEWLGLPLKDQLERKKDVDLSTL